MKRKFSYGLLLTALAINLFIGAQIYRQNLGAAEKDDPYLDLKLFSTVLERVRQDYVDGDKVEIGVVLFRRAEVLAINLRADEKIDGERGEQQAVRKLSFHNLVGRT